MLRAASKEERTLVALSQLLITAAAPLPHRTHFARAASQPLQPARECAIRQPSQADSRPSASSGCLQLPNIFTLRTRTAAGDRPGSAGHFHTAHPAVDARAPSDG
jgi:hypothetical protein